MTTKIPVELSSTPGIVDNSNATAITIDSSENVSLTGQITIGSGNNIINAGNMTIDVAGDLTLDADGGDIKLSDGGTQFGQITNSSNDLRIISIVQDKDIILRGNDNGTYFNALTLDMSEAGTATFNNGVVVQGDLTVQGTTVTLNTATLDVEDKNITLNAGSGDTSGSADGAGITIQDAVDASNNATILWDASNDEFDFSHPINVTGKITATGISQFADVNIPDNNAIRFGSSQDLQIYHDGSHSNIVDNGTGNLRIFGNSQIFLGRSVGGEAYATFNSDGSVNLYYNNALKFLTSSTGINLPVDGDSIKFGANSEIILTHVHDVGLSLTGALSITGDGSNATTLTESGSGDFTIDVGGDLFLDADGAGIFLSDGGTSVARFLLSSSDLTIGALVQDKDIKFTGNDGGSTITALTLDMSEGGSATFNKDILLSDNSALRLGTGQDLALFHDGTNSTIRNTTGNLILDTAAEITLDASDGIIRLKDDGTEFGKISQNSNNLRFFSTVSDADILFQGNDGGSSITALTLDMSDAGTATFNNAINVNGDLKFNSGYGSSVIGYGVRAWVNFNGTGTVAIRDHGNVSSITDNGTGDYTVNFATALPDTNYCVVGSGISASSHPAVSLSVSSASGAQATGSLRVVTGANGGNGSVGFAIDCSITSVAVIR